MSGGRTDTTEDGFWEKVKNGTFEVDLHAQTPIAGRWTRAIQKDRV